MIVVGTSSSTAFTLRLRAARHEPSKRSLLAEHYLSALFTLAPLGLVAFPFYFHFELNFVLNLRCVGVIEKR